MWLCRVAEWVAILALILVTALIMLQIVAREAFVAGIAWADELSRYAGLILIFLAVPMLLARNEHVRVDMFLMMMRPSLRRWVVLLNEILMLVFAALFLLGGWYFMQRAANFATPAMQMPNLYFYMPAFIGMGLMLLVAIDRAIAAFTGRDEAPRGDAAP
jgi:TRAP-type C4-dicarboxylate transport system permease small subunit